MRKASSDPGPAPSGGASDGGTLPACASVDVARRVPGIAVTLPEGPGGQAVAVQALEPGSVARFGDCGAQVPVHLPRATRPPGPGTAGRAGRRREPGWPFEGGGLICRSGGFPGIPS